jgi:hypothetical protein
MSRCRARGTSGEPATLVRAARDFAVKEPRFSAEIGLVALQRLLDGSGYDPAVSFVQEALGHLLGAASRIGAPDWAKEQARSLVDGPCSPGRRQMQHALAVLSGRKSGSGLSQRGVEADDGTGVDRRRETYGRGG